MKVMLVNSIYGGQMSTGAIVASLNSYLRSRGVITLVAFGRGDGQPKEDSIIKIESRTEFLFHVLYTRITGNTWSGGSPKSTKEFIRLYKAFRPDLVNIHEIHGYYVNSAEIFNFLKKEKVPVVLTLHDFVCFTGKCGHPIDCQKFLEKCDKCPHVHDYIKSWFFDKSAKDFALKRDVFDNFTNLRIVAVSAWLQNSAEKSLIFKSQRIQTIQNGIDCAIFSRQHDVVRGNTLIFTSGRKIVLCSAADFSDPIKGGDLLIEIIKAAAKSYPKLFFVLVGGHFNAISSKLNGYHNFKAIGFVSNKKEMANYYRVASLYLLTSLKETFSLACAEALCCGAPVIGFAGCGAPENIVASQDGQFIEGRNANIALKSIASWAEETEGAKQERSERNIKKFSEQAMGENYLSLFCEVAPSK
jgi:putative colanic acid biosynthesis glycosyltransferase